MERVRIPEQAGLIAAVMASDGEWMEQARTTLARIFGPVALQSDLFPFDFSPYYEREMGTSLIKQFISFQTLISMDQIVAIKRTTNHLEEEMASTQEGTLQRRVNIDPGYVALSRLVLATTKDYAHRIYLGQGIYGEVTLIYRQGHFQPLDWTYPDYRTELALDFFSRVRSQVLTTLRRGEMEIAR